MNKITIDYKNDFDENPYGRDYTLSTEVGETVTELVVLFRKFLGLLEFPQGLIDKYITPCEEENLDRISGMWDYGDDTEEDKELQKSC